eukprot:7338150-Lingulodinium_polyedra.AAC.2
MAGAAARPRQLAGRGARSEPPGRNPPPRARPGQRPLPPQHEAPRAWARRLCARPMPLRWRARKWTLGR